MRGDTVTFWKAQRQGMMERIRVDNVGKTHLTGVLKPRRGQYHKVAYWVHSKADKRVFGLQDTAFPINVKWETGGREVTLPSLGIKALTALFSASRFKPPPAEKAWDDKLQMSLPWKKIWKVRSYYTTPRDEVTWLKVRHRNLYLLRDEQCLGCSAAQERILHLVECGVIFRDFWRHLLAFWAQFSSFLEASSNIERTTLLIFGVVQNRAMKPDQAGMLAIAWRCLYAEIVSSRDLARAADFTRPLQRTFGLTIIRLDAYGYRWRRWWASQHMHTEGKDIPESCRDRPLLDTERDGKWHVSSRLYVAAQKPVPPIRGRIYG